MPKRVPRKPRPKKTGVPKGYDSLWEYDSKYIHIREALNKSYTELVFLFQKPFAPMPAAKTRKNGTKRTHAEWAESNNFTWYSEDTLPDEWRNDEL